VNLSFAYGAKASFEHIGHLLGEKDRKIYHGGPYTEMVACVFTDEPLLTGERVRSELGDASFGPFEQLTSGFLVLSYDPGTKSYPVFPLRFRHAMKRSLKPWNREMFHVARCIGRKDFPEAIRTLQSSLVNNSSDTSALELLAHCHRWAGDEEKAAELAAQILRYDANDFAGLKLLGEIHAKRDEPEKAAAFLRRALENYPQAIKPISPKVVAMTKWFSRIFPPLRHLTPRDFEVLEDPSGGDRTWFAWAKEYLAWYDSATGSNSSPVLH
jgi:tetratricopeptide (TPR) repeat protein